MSTTTGAPNWLALTSSDPERSVAFYGELLGWTPEYTGADYGNNVNFRLDGKRVASLSGELADRSSWGVFLHTDDIAETSLSAIANGGAELFQTTIETAGPDNTTADPIGAMVVLLDASGAQVGGWQPGTHTGFEATRTIGAPVWFELHTTNFSAAVDFYAKVFNWTISILADSDEFRYAANGSEELATAGILDLSNYPAPGTSQWLPYFGVENADAAADHIVELGGTIIESPVDSPHGRLSQALDSTGARFFVIQERM